MDRSLTERERIAYRQWLSTITTPESDETLIAFKLAGPHNLHPTRAIRSLRGQKGQDASVVQALENYVRREETLRFVQDGRVRRVAFVR